MGKWEKYVEAPKPEKEHVHDTPSHPMRGAPPGAGSVWRCKCGQTWEVLTSKSYHAPSGVIFNWRYGGETYYLSPFNYDQPSPFSQGGGC